VHSRTQEVYVKGKMSGDLKAKSKSRELRYLSSTSAPGQFQFGEHSEQSQHIVSGFRNFCSVALKSSRTVYRMFYRIVFALFHHVSPSYSYNSSEGFLFLFVCSWLQFDILATRCLHMLQSGPLNEPICCQLSASVPFLCALRSN